MINNAITAFLGRIHTVHAGEEGIDDLYLRLRVGPSRRKSELLHSNIEIVSDSESMLEEIQGYFEGWVWEEGDRCFIELMRAKKTNPLDVVAVLPSAVVDIDELPDEGEEIFEESAVKTLTDALVEMAKDCNHRASISQERYLAAVDAMIDSQIEMAHAQAQLSVEKGEESPAWIKALTAISPAFGPLVGDVATKMQARADEKAIEEKTEPEEEKEPESADVPPVVATPRQNNPLEMR